MVLLWIALVCYVLMFVFILIFFCALAKDLSIAEKAWKAGFAMSIIAGIALVFWRAIR